MLSIVFIAVFAVALVLAGWNTYDVYLDRQYATTHRPNEAVSILSQGLLYANIWTTLTILAGLGVAIASLWWAILFVVSLIVVVGFIALIFLLYEYRKRLLKNRTSASVGLMQHPRLYR